MRTTGDHVFGTEPAGDIPLSIELRVRSKAGTRARIAIQEALLRQFHGRGSYVSRVTHQFPEVPLEAKRPGLQISITESGR